MSGSSGTAVALVVDRIRHLLEAGCAPVLVALDGHSGTGKSTLAVALAAEVGAVVVDGDDFYAGDPAREWDARAIEEDVKRCIDWQRLRREALEPLLAGMVASWHAFDWGAGHGWVEPPTICRPAPVVILDGVYSSRPELADLVTLSVLIEAPEEVRRARVTRRDGGMDQWYARWDAAEHHYLTHVRPPSSFDLVVANGDQPA